jgi:uncharacterized protein
MRRISFAQQVRLTATLPLYATALGVMFAISGAPLARAQSTTPPEAHRMTERTVSVSAQGHSSATPDRASISTGVQTEADTAREAMARNSAVMAKLIESLKAFGITPKDIQTTALQIQPRYTNPRDGKAPVINGYTAINQVTIVVRDLAKLGETLDGALTAGANQMGGISFDVSAAETLKDEARKAAMVNARRRAELYAAAAGATLGPVLSIAEDVRMAGPQPVYGRMKAMAASAVPVEAGSVDLGTTVHVTWALK